MNDDKALFMTAEEYETAFNAVKEMEVELNIKFTDDEFKKMMLLIHDPAFAVHIDD